MPQKLDRDWNAERLALGNAFTQLKIIKLWLQENQQEAPRFAKEFEQLVRKYVGGKQDSDGV